MTQEEKDLLLRDLSARLPYRVIVQWNKCDNPWIPDGEFKAEDFNRLASPFYEIKPYLRPMSSMTEEENLMYEGLMIGTDNVSYMLDVIDWLNAHHFDYRGLIEKGLALEALEEMYKFND